MPKGTGPRVPRARKSKAERTTDDYRHPEATRPNNPEAGLQSFDRKVAKRVRYEYDPHLDPQLVWASKAEHLSFDVDTVSLHVHERISTQAILRSVKREELQRGLFADPELPLTEAVRFYEHEVGWANRLILGDSLLVMNSLMHRELMAGKVQLIFIDPPYGVAYNSNFQPRVDRRDVLDGRDESLTREPEQIKAYRDTWTLGVHSYLTYLRDRLLLARELLAETGSIFVQISDENVHHVRELMDEVFGAANFMVLICYRRLGTMVGETMQSSAHYLVWYARSKASCKTRKLFQEQIAGVGTGDHYTQLEERETGRVRPMTAEERAEPGLVPTGWRPFQLISLATGGYRPNTTIDFKFEGRSYHPGPNKCWRTTREGLDRLVQHRRIASTGTTLRYKQYLDDFPLTELTTIWTDTARDPQNVYVVQTPSGILRRCLLMTTDPGDLVLDPTCGSGTTAYVAEQWGRRWITCDTSRVALSLARQRLMTAAFPYYKLAFEKQGVVAGFVYEEVPHVTLKSIAQDLPSGGEKLYDRPLEVKNVVRVTGPFTVEAINTLDPGEALAFEPVEERSRQDDISHRGTGAPSVNDHLAEMTGLLRRDGGISVPGKGRVEISGLGRLTSRPGLHAEGNAVLDGKPRRIAICFGPRYGPVTARLVEEALQAALGSYDGLVVAGFSFDPEVSAFLEKSPPSGLRFFRVQVAPDVLIGDLLKTRHQQNLFAIVGEPDFTIKKENGSLVVELTGVDIYDPNRNEVSKSELDDVSAWFVDHDYDGRCFCACQVFLPAEKGKAFEKLQRALKGLVDEEAWQALSGFRSRPFKPGERRTVAVKVIDVRGNEVVGVKKLPGR